MLLANLLLAVALQQQGLAAPAGTSPLAGVDTAALRHANGRVPPLAVAARTAGGTPRIDGRLDDAAWLLADPITTFTQREPDDGRPATERTEVRIVYDDDALFVGARLFDAEPDRIVAHLGRRDASTQSDCFEVVIDAYHDHRTAFYFKVNALGVRTDAVFADDNFGGDYTWDPVWEVATRRDSAGWTAEFRIPFSQLRFPDTPVAVWGLNLNRWIQRKAEDDHWAWRSQTDAGYASFFGHLIGIANLPQPRRLEVLPYLAGVEERIDPGAAGNPFNDGSREVGRFGVDVKYGLTSNLTLNATVNPDFGQVEADPAEVNLTAYETYFSERRPFFIEGANAFSTSSPGFIPVSGAQLLYSRRIGRAPQGSAVSRGDGAFIDQPVNTTILGAAKLSGRTAGGWVLGFLDAVTAREYATVDSAGTRFRDEVEPPTNYGVLRARRDFGGGASSLGFMATAVNRRLTDDRLAFLRSAAYAGGVDFSHRFSRNRYSLYAALNYSRIQGDTLAIQAAQRSSARYYQRPDADYKDYDATRTSLMGWNAALGASKDGGAQNWAIGVSATSPGFEVNDLGYLTRADRITANVWTGHRWTRPGRVFRFATLTASGALAWNYGGDRTNAGMGGSAYGQFLNYWSLNAGVSRSLRVVNDALLRGGPVGIAPSAWSAYGVVQSDYRQPIQGYLNYQYTWNELGGWGSYWYASLTVRPTPTINLSVGPSYSVSLTPQQYVTSRADSTATATYGRRYLFAEILQHSLDLTTRLNVTFTPTLSLQLYAQPFVATGDYRRFKELTAPRTTDYLIYGETAGSTLTPVTDADGSVAAYDLDPDDAGPRASMRLGNTDFSSRSLRGNAVLRWEYRPGSTLFLVWQSSCSSFGSQPTFNAGDDLRQLCQGRADNVFAVKVNYWLSL